MRSVLHRWSFFQGANEDKLASIEAEIEGLESEISTVKGTLADTSMLSASEVQGLVDKLAFLDRLLKAAQAHVQTLRERALEMLELKLSKTTLGACAMMLQPCCELVGIAIFVLFLFSSCRRGQFT